MTFGQELRIRRKRKGFTQEGLAKAANDVCTGAYVSDLERGAYTGKKGRPTRPDVDIVDGLARVLDWPIAEARRTAGLAGPDRPADTELTLDMIMPSGYDELDDAAKVRFQAQLKRIGEALLARDE